MAVTDLMVDAGPSIYYDPTFRDVLEDHLDFLRTYHSTAITIKPDESWQWRGDLFGLLQARNEPSHMHWLIMRLNQWTSPRQFDENIMVLMKPNYVEVERIAQSHNSKSRIS